MGKSQSKSVQNTSSETLNENITDTLNKTIMNSGVETLVKNASQCSSSVNQNNVCSMKNAVIGGDFNFGGNQSNKANVNFTCIQANKTSADMASNMIQTMLAEIDTINGTGIAAQLNNASDSSNKSGFGSTGGKASSTSKTNTNNNITNATKNKIQNIYEQNLKSNFTSETLSECIGKTTQTNLQDLDGIIVSGNANVTCEQTNTLEQIQECKQMADAISKTTQETLQELGIEIKTENESSTEIESINKSTSENVSTGPISEIFTGVANVLSSIFNLAVLGPILIIIVVIVIIYLLFSFMPTDSFNLEEINIPTNIPNNVSNNLTKQV